MTSQNRRGKQSDTFEHGVCHVDEADLDGWMSFRENREVKKAFYELCRMKGTSPCDVFRAIIRASLRYGWLELPRWDGTIQTVFQMIHHVKRRRRSKDKYEHETNYYDPVNRGWQYLEDAELNINGHAEGCSCSKCSPHHNG